MATAREHSGESSKIALGPDVFWEFGHPRGPRGLASGGVRDRGPHGTRAGAISRSDCSATGRWSRPRHYVDLRPNGLIVAVRLTRSVYTKLLRQSLSFY